MQDFAILSINFFFFIVKIRNEEREAGLTWESGTGEAHGSLPDCYTFPLSLSSKP